ncbi:MULTISPECIES: hypothetical protein [unclassified Ruegeria]|nr:MULTISPECIES: hypothetical protein [unclassified Ruegeria]NOD77029.1 hypothetical protein [Ruegeria sp. HKCCD4332]NOD89500.1 hypothetical protein [Ruegeria sp. HKCCD4318]NOE13823.1 hypothetical protein [Ruegeria sp. HKCCD4318-2]NOG08242.1 hypothetical protein [Ruegeria sp. HKCCD4315]
MRPKTTRFLPFVVSLLLMLTGQGVAMSRGMDTAVGQMVLCTGTGPVVVYMDESGRPTAPPHYCPDYALSLMGAIAAAYPPMPAPPELSQPAPLRDVGNQIALPVPHTPARAPPVVV